MIAYLAKQLGIADTGGSKRYAAGEMRRDHVAEIRRRYGYRDFHEGAELATLSRWLAIREVHVNSMEGTWAALRTYLRPFRGVSKWHLAGYVAIFEWAHNLKSVTDDFLAILLGRKPNTAGGT